MTCLAAPASLDGRAAATYGDLEGAIARAGRSSPAVMSWAETLAAEIAYRLSDYATAERHFKAALVIDPQDAYLRGVYADFLIDRNRPREAVALVVDEQRNDAMLLRLALAEARFDAPTDDERRAFDTHRTELKARFAASRARGDVVHRREEARFALVLEGNASRALELARANWEVQREPADLRILAEAARAANDAATLQLVSSWQREHRLEDGTLASAAAPR